MNVKMSLSFYRVDETYCNLLRESDPCVPYTIDTKNTRPFILHIRKERVCIINNDRIISARRTL